MSLSCGSKLIGMISASTTNIITRVTDLFFASIVSSDDDGLVVGWVARDHTLTSGRRRVLRRPLTPRINPLAGELR